MVVVSQQQLDLFLFFVPFFVFFSIYLLRFFRSTEPMPFLPYPPLLIGGSPLGRVSLPSSLRSLTATGRTQELQGSEGFFFSLFFFGAKQQRLRRSS